VVVGHWQPTAAHALANGRQNVRAFNVDDQLDIATTFLPQHLANALPIRAANRGRQPHQPESLQLQRASRSRTSTGGSRRALVKSGQANPRIVSSTSRSRRPGNNRNDVASPSTDYVLVSTEEDLVNQRRRKKEAEDLISPSADSTRHSSSVVALSPDDTNKSRSRSALSHDALSGPRPSSGGGGGCDGDGDGGDADADEEDDDEDGQGGGVRLVVIRGRGSSTSVPGGGGSRVAAVLGGGGGGGGSGGDGTMKCPTWLRKNALTLATVSGVLGGVAFGFMLRASREERWTPREAMYVSYVGELFLRMLKCLILPLIVSSLVSAVSGLDLSLSGKIGMRAVAYYMLTTVMAVILGLILVSTIHPGQGNADDIHREGGVRNITTADTLMDLVRNVFPPNYILHGGSLFMCCASDNGLFRS
ncbi:unnamed protein product, partial [Notodromas monacha]